LKTNNKKIALVTGGSKRIGASICEELHKSNINVMIHYKNSKEDALNLKDKLNKIRSNSTDIVQGDLCKTESYEKIISNVIKRFGQLDYLVNNASSYFPTQIDNLNEDDWNDLISTNLKAPLFLCQAAAKFLKEKKGSIVNITDANENNPKKNYIIYNLTKSGLVSLTRSLAVDLAPNVRVNAVAPGAILWPEDGQESEVGYRENLISQTFLKKQGTPKNIAKAVFFLLSTATYTTGEIIHVDGGGAYK
jgi:pteridine reductase